MLNALLLFLVGCLVLVVLLYVAKLVIDMLTLPAEVKQIAYLIIGLIGLVALLILALRCFSGFAPGW